ncbi:MAG: PAS domain S-box protein [Candidatus Margulisbacteria bacterium]|nr:PAS domain S-box protein [Candidatus Margulisiibacteriota bacterium]
MNNFGLAFFGYGEKEVVGKNVIGSIVAETDTSGKDLGNMIMDICKKPDEFMKNENENVCSDGRRVWVAWSNKGILDSQGNVVEILSIGNDISDRIKLENLRQDLSRMIVHDLKNPLSGIISVICMMADGTFGQVSDQQKKMLESAMIASRKLNGLIMDLLDIGKIEENKLELLKTDFRVGDLFTSLKWLRLLAQKEEKTLDFEGDPEMVVHADLNIITRVLENLISNSVKHTAPRGAIILKISKQSGGAMFEVLDNGEGIPGDYLDKVFDKFFMVDDQMYKTKIDTGLGLTFCKMAVNAHGAEIKVESTVGKGSRFFFVIE